MSNSIRCFAYFFANLLLLSSLIGEVSATPLKIGVILPLTGDFAFFGQQAQQGIEIALDELRASGKEVKIVFEDDRCLPKEAVTAFKKLTSVDNVDYVIGPACTGSIVAAGAAAQAAKKYMLALLDTNKEVAQVGEYTYALGYSSEEEAEIVAEHMQKIGISRVGIIYEDDAWAINIKDAFSRRFTSKGGSISSEEAQLVLNAASAPDYRAVITKTLQRKPDALFVVPAYNGGYFIKQLRNMGSKVRVFGPDTFAIAEAIEIAGPHINGVVCANAIVDDTSPSASKLRAAIAAKHGSASSSIFYSALGYDGLRALVRMATAAEAFPAAARSLHYTDGVLPIGDFSSERLAKLNPGLFTIAEGKVVPLLDK